LGESLKVNAKPDQGVDRVIFPVASGLRATKTRVFFHDAARNGQALELFLVTVSANRASPALRARDLSPTEIPV
jgi:hypothetical protein